MDAIWTWTSHAISPSSTASKMFYSTFILQKKGPFAKVWMASKFEKKLTKADIKLVNISETVVNIVKPSVPIALRTSGELMLGVVKIYSHKVARPPRCCAARSHTAF